MRSKRLLSLLLAMAMLFSVIPTAFAVDSEDGVSSTYTEDPCAGDADNELRFEGGEWTMTKKDEVPLGDDSLHGPEDMVKVIVVMEDQPLIKYAAASGMDVGEYMTTSTALKLETAMLDSHTAAVSAIRAAVPEASDIGYNYTAVLNGFSMALPYGRIPEVESIPGVKRVSLVEYYSLPKDQVSFDLQMADSTGIIGSTAVNANASYEGADGSGAVVAILDTGLDIDHEAFKVMPNTYSYSKEKVQELIDGCKKGLSSGVTDANTTWVNEKVPYAYDYAGNDTDVKGGNEHGTHVAGTVAGNNGKDFFGVAPNAQLIIMKIFADGEGSTSNDIITAGLDDAVKLGADSINMSLGSAAGFSYDRTTEDEVYNNCWDAGINLMVASGNDTSSSYMNASTTCPWRTPLTTPLSAAPPPATTPCPWPAWTTSRSSPTTSSARTRRLPPPTPPPGPPRAPRTPRARSSDSFPW